MLTAVYLILFSIGDDAGIRYQAFKMTSIESCKAAVAAGRIGVPDGGDMQTSFGMVCVDSLEGYSGWSDIANPRKDTGQ